MLAVISVAVFVRLNWFYKALISLVAVGVYIGVILGVQYCLYDNYDKFVFGFCWECNWIFELKYRAVIVLSMLSLFIISLGRHVSFNTCTCTLWVRVCLHVE